MGAAAVEWFAQERGAVEAKDVENHSDDWDFRAEEKVRLGAAEAFLEFKEGQGTAFVPGEDFSVENELSTQTASGLGDFGEGGGDAFEVAAEDVGSGAVGVDLGADAVKFWFDPERPLAKSADNRGGVRFGDREHAFDGLENMESGFVETLIAGEEGDLAEVAFEHVGLAHGGGIGLEGCGDGFFEETFLKADAEVAGEDFDEKL